MDYTNKTKNELINEIGELQFRLNDLVNNEVKLKESEKALKQSEEKYRLIAENSIDVIWKMDTNLHFTYLSPSLYNAAGFMPEEWEGTPLWKHCRFIDFLKMGRIALSALRSQGKNELFVFETNFLNKKNEVFPVEISGKILTDESGNIIGLQGTTKDITERKKAEQKIKLSEERFQLAMAASNDGLFDWNLVTNEIYYSPGWKSILGYKDDELPNDFSIWETLTEPEHVKRSWEMQNDLINKKIDRFEMEFKMKHKDGHWIDILSRATAVFNNQGKAVRIVGTHVDITERKRATEQLKKQTQRYQLTLETTLDGYLLADEEGIIIDVNPSYCNMIGYSRDELLTMNIRDVEVKTPPEEVERRIQELVTMGKDRFETNHKCKDGKIIELDTSVSIMQIDNKSMVAAFVRDITNTKQALETLKVQSEIMNNMSEAVYLIRSEDGIIVYTNPEFEKLFGYQENEMIGKHVSIVNAPTDVNPEETAAKIIADVTKDGKWQGEIRNIKKNGSLFWSLARISIFHHPQFGEVLLSVHRDITERKKMEESLRSSQQFNETILNTSPDIIYVYDIVERKNIYSNEGLSKILGYTVEEAQAIGDQILPALMHPDDFQTYLNVTFPRYQSVKDNDIIDHEYRMKDKNGEWHWLQSRESIFKRDEDGSTRQIFGITTDITERKSVDEKILKERNRAQQYLNIADVMLVGVDTTGNVTLINPKGCQVLGYPESEIIGQNWFDNFLPKRIRANVKEVAKKVNSDELETVKYYENEIITKTGEEKLIAWNNAVLRDDEDNIIGTLSSGEDITTKKSAEQALKDSEERFKSLMQQSPFVVELYAKDGLQISVNKAYEELWQFPAETTLNKFNILKSKEVKETGLLEYVNRAYSGEMVSIPEYTFDPTGDTEAKGEGRVRWLSTRIYPIKGKNADVTNIVVTHQDISDRKRYEAELADHRDNLEEQVKIRTAELKEKNEELERYNKLFIGREFRIKELKDEIKKLNKQLGK